MSVILTVVCPLHRPRCHRISDAPSEPSEAVSRAMESFSSFGAKFATWLAVRVCCSLRKTHHKPPVVFVLPGRGSSLRGVSTEFHTSYAGTHTMATRPDVALAPS